MSTATSAVNPSDQVRRNGSPNAPPQTWASLMRGFFSGFSMLANEALSRVEDAESNQKRELALVAHEAASELLKGISPALQGQQKQLDELRRPVDACTKSLAEVTQYLNRDRQEMQTALRCLQSNELDREVLLPMLRQLCRAAKDAIQATDQLRRNHPNNTKVRESAVDLLERVAIKRLEDLSHHGVTPFSAERGDPFIPDRHDAIRREKVPTDDPQLNNHVAVEESPGFMRNGEVIEKSTVFLFELVTEIQPAPSAKEFSNA